MSPSPKDVVPETQAILGAAAGVELAGESQELPSEPQASQAVVGALSHAEEGQEGSLGTWGLRG